MGGTSTPRKGKLLYGPNEDGPTDVVLNNCVFYTFCYLKNVKALYLGGKCVERLLGCMLLFLPQ